MENIKFNNENRHILSDIVKTEIEKKMDKNKLDKVYNELNKKVLLYVDSVFTDECVEIFSKFCEMKIQDEIIFKYFEDKSLFKVYWQHPQNENINNVVRKLPAFYGFEIPIDKDSQLLAEIVKFKKDKVNFKDTVNEIYNPISDLIDFSKSFNQLVKTLPQLDKLRNDFIKKIESNGGTWTEKRAKKAIAQIKL